ncbi:MAG: DNA polymerase III subunit beta [Bacteroidales bacterium]|jgi:DNA polymerase-3 subunit beta|nr:DNA polymerase III subunit beta [Bacteroidales bacterium]MCK9498939.1 DNA polymerase III subunit beta [Bacteroidales bacterium]MDY0313458.1 DNA polymerase III subunit beta [Bacteroidales bacterium]NLB86128.1 DNA polymerase III subunit beta [Bacteroidales bacterium]
MDFVVSSASLLGQLQLVSKVVVSKNALPILDNLLFDIKDSILTVTASDLETTIQTTIELTSCNGEGSIAIETKKLLEILRELPDQPLTFQINVEDQRIDITSSNGNFSMVGQIGDDFPVIPSIKAEKEKRFNIIPDVLYGGISSAIFATGDDELRPIMNGILVEFKNDKISFVATDAHKLVKYSRTELKTEEEVSFILPKKPASLLKGILPKAFSDIELSFDDKNALFTFDNTKLICRLIEGTFPNYSTVIPQDNPNKLVVDRIELLSSLKRVSIFASQSSSLVGIEITGNTLEVSAKDTDYSVAGNETINCQYLGDDMKIGFKSNFLMEILNNISTTEVVFELSDPTRAGIILPKDNENENEDVLMLLMPMMLNN